MPEEYILKVQPDTSLRNYIWQYTFVDFPFEQARQMEFTVLPSSNTRMILFLGEPSLYEEKNTWQPVDRYSLTGFVSRPHQFTPTSTLRQAMVHFTAWGMQPLVDFPLAEITDQRADLNYILNCDLENLSADLSQAPTAPEKARILDHFFMKQLQQIRPADARAQPLVQYILRTKGALRLEDLCKNLFIGERTAQRLVHNAVGVNFKFFSRIVRLEYVRRLMEQGQASLTDVAMQAGYFDQAHFNHDFQEAFSENPRSYLERQQKLVWNKIEAYLETTLK
ncbi:MAG: helix-turn-helix transcriptional regulator [Saprospirales bacterium]|nr:helix-turn-helix transcriptional regulator [Saprospirales bacterium]